MNEYTIKEKYESLLLGVAYYDEYMPYERLQEDISLMKNAGINIVRIAESTWSTLEPRAGSYDFKSIDRVLDAMYEADIQVIVGTPTYAIPSWLVKMHPEVMAETPGGINKYGHRQKMDITNEHYLFYSERVIRKLIEHVAKHPGVVGYQVDNETKHYDTCGENVQELFVEYLKSKFDTIEEMNAMYGLDYWSNRVNDWTDFPSAVGSINTSINSAFKEFQRTLVTDFLSWQCKIIREYSREDQYITHNFDFDWKGYSYGVQKDVDHYKASKAFDIVGIDVYHPSQDELTGCEIAFCGDSARSMKHKQYFVLETQAQGFTGWLHYPGQLKLQALSHIASGASMVAYWHWHSIHNSCETYWKGVLSHDFLPGRTYKEVAEIGRIFKNISPYIDGYSIHNNVGLLVDVNSLSALNDFQNYGQPIEYNNEVRKYYDALYEMNISCDIVTKDHIDISKYALIIVPGLYAIEDEVLDKLVRFTKDGGSVVYGMRTGFSNEHVKVRTEVQPGRIADSCGVNYSQFTEAKGIGLIHESQVAESKEVGLIHESQVTEGMYGWIELLEPKEDTKTLYRYNHPYWKEFSGITLSNDELGQAAYFGCSPDKKVIKSVIKEVIKKTKIDDCSIEFPLIMRKGINSKGDKVTFIFNYSGENQLFIWADEESLDIINNVAVHEKDKLILQPWSVVINVAVK